MGELTQTYCKIVYILDNKTVVALLIKQTICCHLESSVIGVGPRSNQSKTLTCLYSPNLLSEFLLNVAALLVIRVEGLLQCTQ